MRRATLAPAQAARNRVGAVGPTRTRCDILTFSAAVVTLESNVSHYCPQPRAGRYPNLAAGAVATSAPVLAQADFAAYHEVVRSSLKTAENGDECVRVIQNATLQIESLIAVGDGQKKLAEMFSVCSSNLESKLDAANFMATLAGNIDGASCLKCSLCCPRVLCTWEGAAATVIWLRQSGRLPPLSFCMTPL